MKTCFSLFLALFITACSKDSNPAPNTPSSQVFPHEVGNQWIYRYDDGYHTAGQFIEVEIVGEGTLPDGQNAGIWRTTLLDASSARQVIDSSFVVADDRKAVFYTPPCRQCQPPMYAEKRRYIFPLQTGNAWYTDKFYGDTTRVLREESLKVPAGVFDHSFVLSKTVGYVTNSHTNDTIWLTPHVGMTKLIQAEYNLGSVPGNGRWELERYRVR